MFVCTDFDSVHQFFVCPRGVWTGAMLSDRSKTWPRVQFGEIQRDLRQSIGDGLCSISVLRANSFPVCCSCLELSVLIVLSLGVAFRVRGTHRMLEHVHLHRP